MNRHDLSLKTVVYHITFPFWGSGKVLDIRLKDNLGCPTSRRYQIQWEHRENPMWCMASELRKTPNLKKARQLKELQMIRDATKK